MASFVYFVFFLFGAVFCESDKIDIATYHNEIDDWFVFNATVALKNLTKIYSDKVAELIGDVEKTHLRDITKTISLSEELGRLTQTILAVFGRVEETLDDYEIFMAKQDFFIRQEYTHRQNNMYNAI